MSVPLLELRDLAVHFALRDAAGRRAQLRAVDGISLSIAAGETLGIVGESGCGKSTLARAILRLVPVASGSLRFDGHDYTQDPERALQPLRRAVRMVFQDPLASLDPRRTILEAVREPLDIFEPQRARREREREAIAQLERVGLGAAFRDRYPHQLSGGQNQRASIARALVGAPKLVICDESVSALDVSIQAQILNLLMDLQRDTGIALLFISHDLSVVRHISHRLLVLYLGRALEYGPSDRVFAAPRHPYTRSLIDAVPRPDPRTERERIRGERASAPGELPSPLAPPSGCAFRTRCLHAQIDCGSEPRPALASDPTAPLREFACRHPLDAGLELPR